MKRQHNRPCRLWHITVICDDAPPQFFYFISNPTQMSEMPDIISYARFDFIQQWEAEDSGQK
jgi:hypothetical protein